MAKLPRWIEQLSSSYQPNRNFLNGSRIYREAIETNSEISMDWKCDKIYREKKKEGLNRCEVIELDKKEFFKERKTQRDECKQASYSNIDPINMLSSQKHLSTKKKKKKKNNNNNNANHSLIQNTHTHTLNKSNRFYISKTS